MHKMKRVTNWNKTRKNGSKDEKCEIKVCIKNIILCLELYKYF